MAEFTILAAFSSDSLGAMDSLYGELMEAFLELLSERDTTYLGFQIVRGNQITEEVIAESHAIDDETVAHYNAGINSNPLPEGFPEV